MATCGCARRGHVTARGEDSSCVKGERPEVCGFQSRVEGGGEPSVSSLQALIFLQRNVLLSLQIPSARHMKHAFGALESVIFGDNTSLLGTKIVFFEG